MDFADDDVDPFDFITPEDFDLDEAVAEITTGSGYYMLKGMFSQRDVEMARDRVRAKIKKGGERERGREKNTVQSLP